MELAIVVPTRNRAELAIDAIESVLSQSSAAVSVFVSDNSTEERESAALQHFCESKARGRVRYLRPPERLPMTAHWEWALASVLSDSAATHVTYLTDRMFFKPATIPGLLRVIAEFPDQVISYCHDRILDDVIPIRVEKHPWSQRRVRIQCTDLIERSARMDIRQSLPRMLNSVAPRSVIEKLRRRFGNVFSSISPDYNFCYRCLDLEESIILYDQALLVHYALNRSNGYSMEKGIASQDHVDFVKELRVDQLKFATPIPEIVTVHNAIIHEYCVVREETQSPKFPPLNVKAYLRRIGAELPAIKNLALRASIQSLLEQHGWKPEPTIMRLLKKCRLLLSPEIVACKFRKTMRIPNQAERGFSTLCEAISYAKQRPHIS